MSNNMTSGRPLPLIFRFALPLLLGNLLQQTYNIIDAAIVGRTLGANALAGVGASSSIQFLVLGFCIGIACGFGIPVAQYFGAGDESSLKSCVFHACVLTAVFAVILTTATALLCPTILHLLSTPSDIYPLAYQYLLVIFLGIPFTLLYNLCSSMLRSIGDSRTPFLFLACSTVLNVFLDLFCILVLKWGVAGAAIATIAAQAISGLLCLRYICKRMPLLRFGRQHMVLRISVTRKMIVMGLPMGLQYSITAIGSMVMQSSNNALGSLYVSGFTAGTKIKQFMLGPFDAISTAVSVYCGQNLGAGKKKRIYQGLRDGLILAVGYGIVAGIILILFGRTLSMIFLGASSDEILNISYQYLRCMGYFFWSLGFLNVCRLCTQGLGYSGLAVFGGVAEMIARTSVSLIFVPLYGYSAICYTDQAAWIAACIYIIPVCLLCMKKATSALHE